MGLLRAFEQFFLSKHPVEQVDLQEIACRPKTDRLLETFRTAVVGTEYTNADGSERQRALEKLKVGDKVRLIWDRNRAGDRDLIYLLRGGRRQRLNLRDCFGRLNDKVAGDVARWLMRDNIGTCARVVQINGRTRKRAKLGCVLELKTYQNPIRK